MTGIALADKKKENYISNKNHDANVSNCMFIINYLFA